MANATINVNGMSCAHCAAAVKNAVEALPGVSGASVSLEAKTAVVEYDEGRVSIGAIKDAITEEGFEV